MSQFGHCETCKAFVEYGTLNNGECRRSQPRPGWSMSAWPIVRADLGCMDHVPREDSERLVDLLTRYGIDPNTKPLKPPPRSSRFWIRADELTGGPTIQTALKHWANGDG